MSTNSRIEWTDATWNPVVGCTPVSPGCLNCYAAKQSARLSGFGQAIYTDLTIDRVERSGIPGAKPRKRKVFNGTVRTVPSRLNTPYRWKQPLRVFVNSMSDLFHEAVPFPFVADVFTTIAQNTRHTFQVLTKRPARALDFYRWNYSVTDPDYARSDWLGSWPNLWLGVSVESAEWAHRLDTLAQIPAPVLFISFEPLIGPLGDLGPRLRRLIDAQEGDPRRVWAIFGGESGLHARDSRLQWIREGAAQAAELGIPVFIKQLGKHPYGQLGTDYTTAVVPNAEAAYTTAAPLYDVPTQSKPPCLPTVRFDPDTGYMSQSSPKGALIDEWPPDLRRQAFPTPPPVRC